MTASSSSKSVARIRPWVTAFPSSKSVAGICPPPCVRHEYEYCDVCVNRSDDKCSMTVFRFRNDSPVIPRPLHNSATRRLTTLPIELINDQRDVSVAGYKNTKYPPLRGNNGKRHTTSLKLCKMKLDYTSRLMGVNTCAGTC